MASRLTPIQDRIEICWLQAEGLSGALSERISNLDQRSYYMSNEDRLQDLETKAEGLAQALAEIRVLRRYA